MLEDEIIDVLDGPEATYGGREQRWRNPTTDELCLLS